VEPGRREALTDHPAELLALVQLRITAEVGDRTAERLLSHFPSARSALGCSPATYRALTGRARPAEWGAAELQVRAREILDHAEARGDSVLGRGIEGYPDELLNLADPPPVLFARGNLDLLEGPAVTIVGTRRATGSGRRFAFDLGRCLAQAGVTVVSGLALGIDAAAHRGALEVGGPTLAVLANGLDRVHPRSHRHLQEEIGRGGGLLVSEFPPDEVAARHHFPRRNRILAALAPVLVVVEAPSRSGALITVDHALDLGRDIYAVPGPVEYEQSAGTNGLIRDGAWPLIHPRQLLEEGRDSPGGGGSGPCTAQQEIPLEGREPAPAPPPGRILTVLGPRPLTTDQVVARASLPPPRVLQELTELELRGSVVRDAEGWRRPRASPETGSIDAARDAYGAGHERRRGFRLHPWLARHSRWEPSPSRLLERGGPAEGGR
jgi:DNA processing protein